MRQQLFSKRRKMRVPALAACLALALAAASFAETLSPGTTLFRPGSGSNEYTVGGVPAGYVHVDGADLTSPITGIFSGSVVSKLYANNAGEYAFSYQLVNTATNGHEMTSATIGDDSNPWKGIAISDAGADASGLSVGGWTDGSPLAIGRDTTGSGEGLRITFYNALANAGVTLRGPSGYSAITWVVTAAKSYTTTNAGILNSGSIGQAEAYAPVPEPGTLVLLAVAGFVGLFGYATIKRMA